MSTINKSNRQVCNVDFRDVKTKKPVMFFDSANTTTTSISGEAVHAMAKGERRISFANPMEGTMTIEAQVYPFELYSLMSDGIIESTASYPVREVIMCKNAGELDIPSGAVSGTVFVFAAGKFGEDAIDGTYEAGKFTASTASDIEADTEYEVGYIMSKSSGVKKISFNNNRLPNAYYVTMDTVEKDENDVLTPYKIIAYKAQPQRNFEISQSSEGDPVSVSVVLDLLSDKDGNFIDMVEITE